MFHPFYRFSYHGDQNKTKQKNLLAIIHLFFSLFLVFVNHLIRKKDIELSDHIDEEVKIKLGGDFVVP